MRHTGPRTRRRVGVASVTDQPSFQPPGWPTVIPRLVVDDARGLVEFLMQVFVASGTYREEAPTELKIGDSMLMISTPGARQPAPAFLYVYVQDTDATYGRALELGARSVEAPAEMPYGDRRAMVEDRWGNTWQIATRRTATQAG